MGVETIEESDTRTLIKISGRFDLSCHAALRAAYATAPEGAEFIVDLGAASYIDSAALGMLLLLREHAHEQRGRVSIIHCRGETYELLQVANFQRWFRITP
jgi:anti-anti-sigma factor